MKISFKEFISEDTETSFAWRVEWKHTGSTNTGDWQETTLPFSAEEISELIEDEESYLGFLTELLDSTLGIPGQEGSFQPQEYSVSSLRYSTLKIDIDYYQYDKVHGHTHKHAILTLQEQ